MCQDDVKNHFSLQRARVSGGKPTTLQFFESSTSLETELLLSAEMKDTQGTCGSYDMTALPNLVSIPLLKPKQTAPDNLNYFSEKEGWELGYDDQMTSACVAEGTWDFDETCMYKLFGLCISNRITAGVKYILPKKVSKRVGMFTMVYGTAVEQALLDQNHYFLKKTVCIF